MLQKTIAVMIANNVILFSTFLRFILDTMQPPLEMRRKMDEEMRRMTFVSIVLAYSAMKQIMNPGRDFWVFPRQSTFNEIIERHSWQYDFTVLNMKWNEYYKMDVASFERLVELLSPYLIIPGRKVRQPLDIRTAIKIVLCRLGSGMSTRRMRDLFQVGKSTIEKYTNKICGVLADRNKLLRFFIQIPRGDDLTRVINSFEELCGLPNCCGAADGSYIVLKEKPSKKFDTHAYHNRKGISSMLLQGLCDTNKMFLDVCCLFPGGVHDASQFAHSSLYRKLKYNIECSEPILQLQCDNYQPEGRIVQTINVRPYILVDTAYPSREFCMKIFNKPTNFLMKEFDRHIKQGRVVIENIFGILKSKFQILGSLNCHVDNASKVIVACCALHNFCRMATLGLPLNEPRPAENVPPYEFELNAKSLTRKGQVLRSAVFQKWLAERENGI